MKVIDWNDPVIAAMRIEWLNKIENEVGSRWMKDVSEDELNYFLIWAVQGQVYFYPGNNEKLGDAFRGYVIGIMQGKKSGVGT